MNFSAADFFSGTAAPLHGGEASAGKLPYRSAERGIGLGNQDGKLPLMQMGGAPTRATCHAAPPSAVSDAAKENRKPHPGASWERGVTLIEIIVAIVVIGLAVPLITIPFSANKDTKHPEYVVHASFIAQRLTEEMAGSTTNAAQNYCNNFTGTQESVTANDVYNIACSTILVDADTPDDAVSGGQNDVGNKVTLTITRADGEMSPAVFYSFFHK
jgi:prepilin-type N-terminal cleavage/methylation domain-containing protein